MTNDHEKTDIAKKKAIKLDTIPTTKERLTEEDPHTSDMITTEVIEHHLNRIIVRSIHSNIQNIKTREEIIENTIRTQTEKAIRKVKISFVLDVRNLDIMLVIAIPNYEYIRLIQRKQPKIIMNQMTKISI